MKKSTMNTILSLIASIDSDEANEVRAELTAELNRGEAKKEANATLYDAAKSVIFEELGNASNPVTIGELFEAVESKLPEGFSKGKLQYAVTRLWVDEIAKTEGKVNAYSLR